MKITAKRIAQELNISEAAVSMALNNKPGVSTETRKKIKETARTMGYDFTKIKSAAQSYGTIDFIMYQKHGAVITDTPFFNTLSDSAMKTCKKNGYKFNIKHIISDAEDDPIDLDSILSSNCIGILLLGTEMKESDFFPFAYTKLPIVILDTYFSSSKMDCVLINNVEGAYLATKHLISKRRRQPGYLHSSYSIYNFIEREEGFIRALRDNGLSSSNSIIHHLSPSLDGAYADMKSLLEAHTEIADCYFADNDLIAAGAIKAFKEFGYRIPEDVAIVGFDNMPLCSYISPNLTTINVPIKYLADIAVHRLLHIISGNIYYPIKIEVNPHLVIRNSV